MRSLIIAATCFVSTAATALDVDDIVNKSLTEPVGIDGIESTAGTIIMPAGSVPGGDASLPGRGFSTLGFDWRGDCVEFDTNTAKPPINSPATNFQLDIMDTVDKFSSMMSISASASMSYGIYSGDLSAQYLKRYIENSYSNYIAGKVTVYTVAANIGVKGLTQLGKRALAAGPNVFHRTCGNKFATSVVYGGEFIFILDVKSRDATEFESIKADLKASVGNFGSGSASFAQSMERVSSKYQLTATVIRNGLREVMPDLTPTALATYAKEFPSKITANDGIGMRPIRYGLREYTSIEPSAPSMKEAELFLGRLTADFIEAARIAGDFDYWSARPDEFFYVDNAPRLLSSRSIAIKRSQMLEEAAIRCSDRPGSMCKPIPNLPQLDSARVPLRLTWVKLPVSDNRRVVLGVVPKGETRRVRYRGLWSPSGGTTWWATPDGAWKAFAIDKNGKERTLAKADAAGDGERVEVALFDNPYEDNREHSTDPASAALY